MKAIYRGPADSVEIDGVTVKRGEAADLTAGQVARIRADPGATLDVTGDGETAETREKTVAAQAKQRERQVTEATKVAAMPAAKE